MCYNRARFIRISHSMLRYNSFFVFVFFLMRFTEIDIFKHKWLSVQGHSSHFRHISFFHISDCFFGVFFFNLLLESPENGVSGN